MGNGHPILPIRLDSTTKNLWVLVRYIYFKVNTFVFVKEVSVSLGSITRRAKRSLLALLMGFWQQLFCFSRHRFVTVIKNVFRPPRFSNLTVSYSQNICPITVLCMLRSTRLSKIFGCRKFVADEKLAKIIERQIFRGQLVVCYIFWP